MFSRFAFQERFEVINDEIENSPCSLNRSSGSVGSQVDVWEQAERRVEGKRLCIENVDGGVQISALKSSEESLGIDKGSATDVHEDRMRGQTFDYLRVDE